ncbi:MAG: MJ1477/TM1410 family putative glycoside hydrolase [Hyphomicrobiaceae bacterium]
MIKSITGFMTFIGRTVRARPVAAGSVALLVAVLGFMFWPGLTDAQRALRRARVWDYQLQNANLDRFAGSAADVVVMDYATTGKDARPYTKAEVDRVRRRPDGGKRIVLAYFSIGEAEEYRPYWNTAWKTAKPDWIVEENCRWPRNHIIKFWSDEWKDIIFRGKDAYLKRILAAGFDGVYLDRIDVYSDLEARFPQAKDGMLGFIRELAAAARAEKSDALIVAQNAEDLLDYWRYRWAIDAVAKEDLFYGVGGSGVRNEKSMIDWSVEQLKKLASSGKPIFIVEYLSSPELVDKARAEVKAAGMIGTFPTRALDGRDPLVPDAAGADALKTQAGTPEFGAHCKDAAAVTTAGSPGEAKPHPEVKPVPDVTATPEVQLLPNAKP